MSPRPENIEQVVARLDEIIEWAKTDGSRLGYFAALYRKVTVEVGQGIDDGFFEDGPRMERLDVIFANRYLDAFDTYRQGGTPTRSWVYAFNTAERWWPIVLQHLLLGMNAHINLDLGIAAARTVPADQLPGLKGDFDRINTVLARLVGSVQDELAEIWTVLRWLNRYLGSVEDVIINFSMERARDEAWSVAERLAPLDASAQTQVISDLDARTLEIAEVVRHPGFVGSLATRAIRLGERGSVPQIIEILS